MRYTLSLIIFCLFFSANLFASPERVLNFDSSMIINKDASLDVTEVISVHANQDRILHGIVRRLPMQYMDANHIQHNIHYQVRQIFLNNVRSTYHIEYSNHQFAIYIGDLEAMLPSGEYIYTLQYHVNNAVHFLENADEFYWPVTGNEWDFPIDKAQVTVRLPAGADISQYAGYTGTLTTTTQNLTATRSAQNQITFVTTQPLDPGENFTISLTWPKGIVNKPTFIQKIKFKAQESTVNYPLVAVVIALLALAYFAITRYRRRYNKDLNNRLLEDNDQGQTHL